MLFKKKRILTVLFVCLLLIAGLTACSSYEKSPVGAIKNMYGNEEYRISFSQDGLETPISDLYYTAYSIPLLPTPEKVGYVFLGWYYDVARTEVYDDDSLYMKMCDVTLYAKWEKEELSLNGVYDITYSAEIVEGTVKKGDYTDLCGGYRSFADSLIESDTYIERMNGRTLLKLQYDCGVTVPFAGTSVFTVSVAPQTGSSVFITDSITAETSTEKTLWLDITQFNMSDTIYLSVSYMNWETDGLTDTERQGTVTTYTVAFRITRFIGFSRSFVDVNSAIEDGYYMVKTYFRLWDGADTMLDTFNPVYSYIIAKDGNYTLVKPFSPYFGMTLTAGGQPDDSAYYSRMTTYYRVASYFDASYVPDGVYDITEWETGYYRGLTYEFHADTGKYYYVFDLGSDLTNQIILTSMSTGFMEAAFGTGLTGKLLILDTDNIVKLSEIDYEPLAGDSYTFSEQISAYPYEISDFSDNNTIYSLVEEEGLTYSLANFFFSSNATSLGSNDSGSCMYSTKITFTPTAATASVPISETTELAHYTVTTNVYGYEATDNNLWSDSMRVQAFGTYSLREKSRYRIGKTYTVGDAVSLEELYGEKVSSAVDFGRVSWKAYKMTDGKVDFNTEISVAKSFTFTQNIAVLFTMRGVDTVETTLIELAEYEEPQIFLDEDTYDPNADYVQGTSVSVPIITSVWYGVEQTYTGFWTDDPTSAELDVNPMNVVQFAIDATTGVYRLTSRTLATPLSFNMTASNMSVMYELRNPYGEFYHVFFDYKASVSSVYEIIEDGEAIVSSAVKYTTVNGVKLRTSVSESSLVTVINTAEEFAAAISKTYNFSVFGVVYDLPITECKISMKDTCYYLSDLTADGITAEIERLLASGSYAAVEIKYTHDDPDSSKGTDSYTRKFILGVTFAGSWTLEPVVYNTYYNDVLYIFEVPLLRDALGNQVGKTTASLYYYQNGRYSTVNSSLIAQKQSLGQSLAITFIKTGQYRLQYYINMSRDSYGLNVFADGETFTGYLQFDFTVKQNTSDVTVVFHTDEEHPFANGLLTYTVTYSLSQNIIMPNKTVFDDTPDYLYAWGKYETTKYSEGTNLFLQGKVVSDFIGSFNSDCVDLYAIWDKGVIVTADLGNGKTETKKYYLTYLTESLTSGYYSMSLTDFEIVAPTNYIHIGWAGDIFENGFTDSTSAAVKITGDCTITAVYKRLLTIKYEIDRDMSSNRIANDTGIVEDSVVAETLSESDLNKRLSITCKAEGYEFKYWALTIDGELVKFDLLRDELKLEYADDSGVVTLTAVFGLTEEG